MNTQNETPLDYLSFSSIPNETLNTESPNTLKQLTVTVDCTSLELQLLMSLTIETLDSVNLSIDTQKPLPGSSKRRVSITASCSAQELGKFISLVTENMTEARFAVAPFGS